VSMDLKVKVIEGKDLIAADSGGTSDPYVTVRIQGVDGKHKTHVIKKTLNPVWNEEFELKLRDSIETLEFHVWDHDLFGRNDPLGTALISLNNYNLLGPPIDIWLALQGVPSGQIHVSMNVSHMRRNPEVKYENPPARYTIPDLLPDMFIPPPAGYFGSNPYSTSQVLVFKKKWKKEGISHKSYISIHGPINVITPQFIHAVNSTISSMAMAGSIFPIPQLEQTKMKEAKGTIHWKTSITEEFQENYEADLAACLLNLFEYWGWRLEKQYDAGEPLGMNQSGVTMYSSYYEALIFRRAV